MLVKQAQAQRVYDQCTYRCCSKACLKPLVRRIAHGKPVTRRENLRCSPSSCVAADVGQLSEHDAGARSVDLVLLM